MPNIEGITVQKSNAERKSYVVVGAILSCSSGSQLSRLKMPFSHGVFVKGKPQMNIMDFVPNINIMPFGKCSSLKNPAVASATAANNGVLTPMPCTPVMTMPWIDGKPDKMVGEHPALLNKSTNMCFHCGQIKIEDDGQDLGGVTVGNQSPANSGSPNANFEQGPACEKPQEKPSMWDHFVKGISKLGDVPAAMQKAASELPGALEKAAEDLPKGIGVFVREGYIEPMQEDLDTLRDDKLNLADGIALGGLALNALTLGRSKNIKNVVDVTRKGKRANDKIDYVEETGRLGGTLYNDKDLRLLGNYLEKRGVTLKVGDEFLPPGKGGGFNYNTDELVLRSNPTQYEVWHELSHYLHYRRIGKDAYSNLPRTYGPVPMNDLTQFNAPEQFVYDMLSNSPKRWNSLNEAEQLHANWYIMQYGGLR